MVLIDDDEYVPRLKWKRGVVDELIKGKDGKVRGVSLRVFKDGKISYRKRPIQRLVPFEVGDKEYNSAVSQEENE